MAPGIRPELASSGGRDSPNPRKLSRTACPDSCDQSRSAMSQNTFSA
jgi:hypothetical protein